MKQNYLDWMEQALSAYTPERICAYVDEVKQNGLTEHGFPRLGANIGILLAYGRRTDLKERFVTIMDLCCAAFPSCTDPKNLHSGVNFAIREVCCALMELERADVIEQELLAKWKKELSALDPWTLYSHIASEERPTPANWACFAALSEQIRGRYCGVDTTAFVDNQLPSQLLRLDENGMYRDDDLCFDAPHQPIAYDLVARTLFALLLHFGYNGTYAAELEDALERSDELTLQMQSVTGEVPFGGRSNQLVLSEMNLASYCELRAAALFQKGNIRRAVRFKTAAEKAAAESANWLSRLPMSHVKNRFDPDLRFGCEAYAYFNKYMITVASHAYQAFLAADDRIEPTVCEDAYVVETGAEFHKVFINCGGYFLEFDLNADLQYDACGLGRVQKVGCDPRICLAVPFPQGDANYRLETTNPHPMSVCGYQNTANGIAVSAGSAVTVTEKSVSDAQCTLTLSDGGAFTSTCTVSRDGVSVEFPDADGILFPVFAFDGETTPETVVENGSITVTANGSVCKYTFSGAAEEYGVFFNRNGRYRVWKTAGTTLHIELGKEPSVC